MNWYEVAVAVISGFVAFVAASLTRAQGGIAPKLRELVRRQVADPNSPSGWTTVMVPAPLSVLERHPWLDETLATVASLIVAFGTAAIGFSLQKSDWLILVNTRIHTEAGRIAKWNEVRSDFIYVAIGAMVVGWLIAYDHHKRVNWGKVTHSPLFWVGAFLAGFYWLKEQGGTFGVIGFLFSNIPWLILIAAVLFLLWGFSEVIERVHYLKEAGGKMGKMFGGDGGKAKAAKEARELANAAIEKADAAEAEARAIEETAIRFRRDAKNLQRQSTVAEREAERDNPPRGAQERADRLAEQLQRVEEQLDRAESESSAKKSEAARLRAKANRADDAAERAEREAKDSGKH